MYKTFIFIALLTIIASCDKKVKPLSSKEEELLVIDTLQIADLRLSMETTAVKKDPENVQDQDLIIKIEKGNFEALSNLYYGSTKYSTLLKKYNGYEATDMPIKIKDSLIIPTFSKLVYGTKEKISKREKRSTDSLIAVYTSYRSIQEELRAISKLDDTAAKLPENLQERLHDLSDKVAVIYTNLQLEENRPHGTIGELKALSAQLTRMAQDSLSGKEKRVDVVHYRLAAAFGIGEEK